MIVAVPSEDSFLKYATNGILNMPPHHVTRWSDETFGYIAKRYNLEIETIYHEKVQTVHKGWYFSTLISSLFLQNRLIDLSFTRKILNKLSSLAFKLFAKNIKDEFLPNGHTVLVVFKKGSKYNENRSI